MSRLRLNEVTTPAVPASPKQEIYADSADHKIKVIDHQGWAGVLSLDGLRGYNRIINGDFGYAQRQIPTTLTTYAALTGGRQFSFDRWFHSISATSTMTIQQVDNTGGADPLLTAMQYAKYKIATAVGKFMIGQTMEATNMQHLLGTKVRVQVKMRYAIAASMTVRLGLLQVNNAGTVDSIGVRTANGFISAFGATGTDPTLTVANNMSYIAPNLCETNGVGSVAIVGSGVDCVLTANFARYSATFTIPASSKNLVPVIWTNNASVAVGDELHLSEFALYPGEEIKDWHPLNEHVDYLACSRYYVKSFPLLIAPVTNAGLIGALNGISSLAGATALSGRVWWHFATALRRNPVAADITLYNPSAANAVMRHPYIATPIDMGATAVTANLSSNRIEVAATGVATTLVGSVCAIHAAVDVDI